MSRPGESMTATGAGDPTRLTDRRPDTDRRRRRLSELADRPTNYDPERLSPRHGYEQGIRHFDLATETPGAPEAGGSWEAACGLVADYAFADPATVRAFYGPRPPEPGRDMLLRLRSLNTVSVYAGVRVQRVIDERREESGRPVRIWGWTYGTLAGHIEEGEMSWQAWKWLDDGRVQFAIHWISKPAPIHNPIIKLGFKLVGPHERENFLGGAGARMQRMITATGR